MDIKATLVERVSKSGNPYTAIEIKISDSITKLVFLTQAEIELLKIRQEENSIPEGWK